jgi:hypothetical protein
MWGVFFCYVFSFQLFITLFLFHNEPISRLCGRVWFVSCPATHKTPRYDPHVFMPSLSTIKIHLDSMNWHMSGVKWYSQRDVVRSWVFLHHQWLDYVHWNFSVKDIFLHSNFLKLNICSAKCDIWWLTVNHGLSWPELLFEVCFTHHLR